MAAGPGRAMVIKIGDGASPEVFTAVAGARIDGIRINNELVNVSDKTAAARKLLDGGGEVSWSMNISGIYLDNAQVVLLRTKAGNGALTNFELDVHTFGTYSGSFQVQNYEENGDYNGAITFSATMESSAAVTYA